MSSRPVKTPQRVPPPRLEPLEASVSLIPAPPEARPADWHADTLATDEYALQAQLDQLADQFEQMKAQLRHAQKLASIGTTAAMLAHEFNNLLTPVVAYARHALDTGDVELMRTALTKTLDRAGGLREMADRIVGFAKQSDTVLKPVQVLPLVENAIGCLGRDLAKDNISVNLQIDPALAVRGNENQLLQVLFNLVINARQAMLGRRGRLAVDAAPTHDGSVRISVRDTGCGIPAENLPRIFEPFFTTKKSTDRPDHRGLGLGLSICRDILRELGGTIDVESEAGAGTTFVITLPQAE